MNHKKINAVFISYRRQDAAATAGRISDYLKQVFPKLKVFVDVETISGGENFSDKIFSAISESDIFISLIGKKWAINEAGINRLMDEADYVRQEITAALGSNCKVFPVLLNDCKMPEINSLPAELKSLCSLNALELRNSRFKDDLIHIIEIIFSIHRTQQEKKWLPTVFKSTLIGVPVSMILLFIIAQLNYWLTDKSLAILLGEGLTTTLLVTTPLITSFLLYNKFSQR